MNKADRLVTIVEMLRRNNSVKNSELCELFGTSDMTIRRDIDELEKAGVLKRVHGGAVNVNAESFIEMHINDRVYYNAAVKEEVARIARRFVMPEEVIYMDTGSSVFFLAREMVAQPIKLHCYTNSLNCAVELGATDLITTTVMGGELKGLSMCTLGSTAEQQIRNIYFDASFFSCNGISTSGDVMLFDFSERFVKNAVMERSKKKYLLCDSTKVAVNSTMEFARVTDFDAIFIDSGISAKDVKALQRLGTNIVTV